MIPRKPLDWLSRSDGSTYELVEPPCEPPILLRHDGLGCAPPEEVDRTALFFDDIDLDIVRSLTFSFDPPRNPTLPSVHTLELSGAVWVSRFPTSISVEDLAPGFKNSVTAFIDAIGKAGGSEHISATYRPPERAYLMHYAWEVAHGKVAPSEVPAKAGVGIQWDHGDDEISKRAAQDMVNGYHIKYPPSLTSNHTRGIAIDMTISGVVGKKVKDKNGKEVEIKKATDLYPVGATYGVHKLISDPPHWSADGH